MAITTPNMKLNVWNSLTDVYDHSQLASNFIAIDAHDHGSNGGAQIDGSVAIKDASIPGSKMASDFSYSFASGSIPGSAIASNSITNQQMTNFGVSYARLGAHPYCEMTKTSDTGFVSNTFDQILNNYDASADNMSTINAASNPATTLAMANKSAGTITAPINGIYMVQGWFEFDYPNASYPLSTATTSPYISVRSYNGSAYTDLGRSGFSTNNYRANTTNSPDAANVFAICKVSANQTFSMAYRVPAAAVGVYTATLRACWISPYDNA